MIRVESPGVRYLIAALVGVAFILIELLIGGTRLAFSLPAYALLAMAGILSAFTRRQSDALPGTAAIATTVLFFGYVLVRQIVSPVEYLARSDLLMVLASLAVYFAVTFRVIGSTARWLIVAIVLLLGLGQIGAAAFQLITGDAPSPFGLIRPQTYGVRATGFYICPNHLAGFLEVVALFAVGVAFWSRRSLWLKLLCGYVGLAGLVAIIVTGSRGGYLSMAVALAAFAGISLLVLRKARPDRFWLAATFTGIAGALVAAFLAMLFFRHDAVHMRSLTVADDFQTRLGLWQAALQQFHLSPAVGTGSGTYYYYGQMFRAPVNAAHAEYAHNDYLQFLAEFGVVGAILLLVFVAAHLRAGWQGLVRLATERGGRSQSDRLAFSIAAFGAVVAYLVHSAVDFNLHIPANTLLLAFCFGLLANAGATTQQAAASTRALSYFGRFALPALAVWMIFAGLKTWPAEYYGEQARAALCRQEYDNTIALSEKALEWDRTNPFLWLYCGQAYAERAAGSTDVERTNNWVAASNSFSQGVALFPQERWLRLGLAEAMDALGEFGEAESHYQSAMRWDPNSAEVRALYAMHLRTGGHLAEAEEHFKKSLALRYTFAAAQGLQKLAAEQQTQPR